MSIQVSGGLPGHVIVERQTPLAIHAIRIMLALAGEPILEILLLLERALVGVAVALAATAHGNVRDGVVVGLEHLWVIEHLVAERVQSIQSDSNVGGSHPVLELRAILKIVRTRTILECAEHHRGSCERRNVTELVRAQRHCLVAMRHNVIGRHAISLSAARAIILIRLPSILFTAGPLIDGEALRPRRMKLNLLLFYLNLIFFLRFY